MLILGAHGTGAFGSMALGSVARHTTAHASCPVVVVRGQIAAVHRQVGIGIGDLDTCADSLTFAFEEASLLGVHAWHVPRIAIGRAGSQSHDLAGIQAEVTRQLAGLLDNWRKNYPHVPASQTAVRDHPGRVLAGLSARADLVVIGRHASRPSLPGPGSVRHAVLNHALGPVAVVPPS
jgi:nucleotide-binding universal stress UspA family protein